MNRYLKWLFLPRTYRLISQYLLIIFTVSFLGNLWMTRHQVKGLTPAVVSKDLNGQTVKLKFIQTGIVQKDTPTLLYFFAEWCPICKMQHPVITSIDKEFDVIGIAMMSGNNDKVRQYMEHQNIDFKVVNDETGSISRSFGVKAVPAVFVIDKMGQINHSTRGYTTEAGLRSRIWLADNRN